MVFRTLRQSSGQAASPCPERSRRVRLVHSWERATPVALMGCRNEMKDAPLEWRAPSKDHERGSRRLLRDRRLVVRRSLSPCGLPRPVFDIARQDLALADMVGGGHHALLLHAFDDAGGAVVADLPVALDEAPPALP